LGEEVEGATEPVRKIAAGKNVVSRIDQREQGSHGRRKPEKPEYPD
jgi:hypothetical protein